MIAGRVEQLEAIDLFLAAAAATVGGLVVVGEPGIGKTTLWAEGVARARQRATRVLEARPVEAEARLSYASLADLLGSVSFERIERLPAPQRSALEVALLRAAPTRQSADQRGIGMALVSLLADLAAEQPLLVAIDDLHWLDRPTARVVAFAIRRLEGVPLGLLATRRAAAAPSVLEEALGERVRRVEVGPLALGSLHVVIKERLGRSLPRLTLLRVEEASGGNPMLALELARALEGAAPIPPGAPLPVPRDLLELERRRLRRLGAGVQRALLPVAALSRPTPELVDRAAPRSRRPLEAAELAGILERSQGRLRFSHPLLASAVLSLISPEERRLLHRRLAQLVEDVEEQARHEALASAGADARVAARLSDATRTARSRGATDAAAELAALACELTPAGDPAAGGRRLELAECLFAAGETERAEAVLMELQTTLRPSPLRARALVTLASVYHETRPLGAAELCEEALAQAGDDAELRARIYATWALTDSDHIAAAEHHAAAALDQLARVEAPDPIVEGLALLAFAENHFYLGRGLAEAASARALELERRAPPSRVADRFSAALAVWLKYSDRLDEARAMLLAALEAAREEHDESSLPFVFSHLPQLELWAGNWPLAERYAREHLELAERTGQAQQRAQALYNVAEVEAHLGRVEEARATIAAGLADAATADSLWAEATFREVLGFLEWSLGDAERAAEALERTTELRGQIQLADPGYGRRQADLVEALAALGRVERALAIVEAREARARALDRPAALAVVARCRAVLAATSGDIAAALAYANEAMRQHERLPLPFEIARTLLVKGRLERRARQKRTAHDSLTAALAEFERLGAVLWAETTRAELARVGLRPQAPASLTASERRIAELAAEGRTNKEIAGALFVSPKKVEANLARVYRKLAIRSRSQLARHLPSGEDDGQTSVG